MKFLLLVRVPPDAAPTPEEADPTAWNDDAARRGILLERNRLQDPPDATTVRVRDGKTLVADGPFAEFKEYVAGYGLIETGALADAIALAAQHPVARFGSLEVRELWDFAAVDEDRRVPEGDVAAEGAAAQTTASRRRYVLIHAHDGRPADPDSPGEPPTAWIEEMERRNVCHGGSRLRPAAEASTVRIQNGETLVTHGPYPEVQEQVAGYDLIAAADLDEAIEIAAKHPTTEHGAIEIRPLWEQ